MRCKKCGKEMTHIKDDWEGECWGCYTNSEDWVEVENKAIAAFNQHTERFAPEEYAKYTTKETAVEGYASSHGLGRQYEHRKECEVYHSKHHNINKPR